MAREPMLANFPGLAVARQISSVVCSTLEFKSIVGVEVEVDEAPSAAGQALDPPPLRWSSASAEKGRQTGMGGVGFASLVVFLANASCRHNFYHFLLSSVTEPVCSSV